MSEGAGVVLVTGSSGFIGSAVIRSLEGRYRLVGFDKEGDPHPPPAAECVCVDLTREASVRDGFERARYGYGHRISSVLHLAAYYDFSGEPSPLYEEINIRGTERLLHELQAFDVEQLVYSSTVLVHAPCQPGERIDEGSPLDPRWDYPKSKLRAEQRLLDEHGSIPVVVLRMAGVYDDLCHSVPLAHQIQRIHERSLTSRVFPGDTSHGQAYLHLDDLVAAFGLLVDQRERLPNEAVLLLGEPETLSYDELQRTIGRLLHGEVWETKEIPKAAAKTGAWLQDVVPFADEPFIKPWMIDLADDHYALDVTRARTLLGWEPARSLRETVPQMVAALKRDPVRWYRANKLQLPAGLHEAAEAAR